MMQQGVLATHLPGAVRFERLACPAGLKQLSFRAQGGQILNMLCNLGAAAFLTVNQGYHAQHLKAFATGGLNRLNGRASGCHDIFNDEHAVARLHIALNLLLHPVCLGFLAD